MAPAFSKEAILQGSIDHLCLACESYLRSERDVCLHVSTADHRRNVDSTDYVHKYRNDRIRKIKKWYYCEFCNILVSTIPKVRLHVEEFKHREYVSSQKIIRVDDVILSGNIQISDDAWHGFIDENTCIICNKEFDDKDDHRNESSHIVKLIESNIVNDDDNCYRKIDNTTFHCLTCNTVMTTITMHLEDKKHKTLLQQCTKGNPKVSEGLCQKENATETPSSQSVNKIDVIDDKINLVTNGSDHSDITKSSDKIKESKVNNDISDQKYDHTSEILDSIEKFQKEDININLEYRKAVCRRCTVTLDFNSKVIHDHIEQKHNIEKKVNEAKPIIKKDEINKRSDSGSLLKSDVLTKSSDKLGKKSEETKPKHDMIKKLAEENDITYSNNKLFCQRCNKNIPSSVKNINEHISGDLHKNNTLPKAKDLKDSEKKLNVKKTHHQRVPIHQFVRTITTIKNMLGEDVVINDKYCINILAFIFLTTISPGKLRCLVCKESVLMQNIQGHIDLSKHARAMNEIPVITNFESEFIREIGSDTYQCGFCNIIDTMEGMENHLKSTSHRECRTFAGWRLNQHLPLIHQHNFEREIQKEFLTRLLFS